MVHPQISRRFVEPILIADKNKAGQATNFFNRKQNTTSPSVYYNTEYTLINSRPLVIQLLLHRLNNQHLCEITATHPNHDKQNKQKPNSPPPTWVDHN